MELEKTKRNDKKRGAEKAKKGVRVMAGARPHGISGVNAGLALT